jgi:hypothetical protein
MTIRGLSTGKNSKVKISTTPMGLCMSYRRRMARSTLVENTSGLSVKSVEKVAASDPNPTGRNTMDPVILSRQNSNNQTKTCSEEKLYLYTAPKVV